MSIDSEVAALLSDAEDGYKQGLESANPAPKAGTYSLLLRAAKTSRRKEIPVITLIFEVIGNPEYPEYRFAVDFWTSNTRSMAELAQVGAAANRSSCPTLVVLYGALEKAIDKGVFEMEVSWDEWKGTGYAHLATDGMSLVTPV